MLLLPENGLRLCWIRFGSDFMSSAKLQVRHILFKKIVFLIFLNDLIAACYTIPFGLKRKNQTTIFSFQSMPNLQFCSSL